MTPPDTSVPVPTVRRRRLGRGLTVFGLVVIIVAVITVLEAANGPGTGPKTFAQRRSYNQVKESVHATYPLALLFALTGLGIAMAGARLQRTASEMSETGEPDHPPRQPRSDGEEQA